MRRRTLIQFAAATLAAPAIASSAEQRVLRFIPHTDLAVLDPLWTNALITRNHALLVFDTLFGIDNAGAAKLQMLEAAEVDEDGRRWTLTLRSPLRTR